MWDKLFQEQKQFIINKYIESIEITIDKDNKISISNIIFNQNEIENIGYMFRNDCFDMVVSVEDKDVILSSYKNNQETESYISNLRNFYHIKEIEIDGELFDINEYNDDEIIQIIPQTKKNKFEKINLKF